METLFQGTLPKPRYPSDANSNKETKKVWTLQPKPSLVQLEEQLEEWHRQGAVVQHYPSDYITPPVALVQHCSGRGAAQRSSAAASAAGKLRSISLACRLHNTTTLHLTSVRSSVRTSVRSQSTSQSKELVNLHVVQTSIAHHNILCHVLTENNAVEHSAI